MEKIINFTDSDVANTAISIEERGIAFYTSMAKKIENQTVRDLFLRLAEEEKEHRDAFKYIFKDVNHGNRIFSIGTAHYLKSLLKTSIFPKEEELSKIVDSLESPSKALALGIQAEKDAILLYHELYNNVDNEETKKTINRLLEAEKLHLVDLREQIEELS